MTSMEVTALFERMLKNVSKNVDVTAKFPLNSKSEDVKQAVKKVGILLLLLPRLQISNICHQNTFEGSE